MELNDWLFIFFIWFAGFTLGWHIRGGVENNKKSKDGITGTPTDKGQ